MESRRKRHGGSSRKSKRVSTDLEGIPLEDRELIRRFVESARGLPGLQAVVLYGSFARGDIDRRSDIDVLLVVDAPDPGALRSVLARQVSALHPHREINPMVTNLRDVDPSFLRNVFREGIVLLGKLLLGTDHLALQARVLLAYDLTGAAPSQKVRISRAIHGFESTKVVGGRRKTYRYPGLREKYGAEFVSPSVLILKRGDADGFLRELDALRVPYRRWDLYL